MRQDHRFQKQKGLTAEQKRLIPVIALPVIALCLIAVIMIADHKKSVSGETESRTAAESMEPVTVGVSEEETGLPDDVPEPGEEPETTAAAETETEETAGEDPYETEDLRRDSMPELLDLMKQYFTARINADAAAVQTLYGVTDASAEELEAERLRLMSNSRYIYSFEDVATYVMQGTDENNWLVYTTANIHFYTAETRLPMIMWCFIERDAEGGFRILNSAELPSSMLEFAETANHSDAVRKLAGDINAQLNHALDTDEDLKTIYGILRSGSPLYDETEAEVVVVDGSEAAQTGSESALTSGESAPVPDETVPVSEESASAAEESAPVPDENAQTESGTAGENEMAAETAA